MSGRVVCATFPSPVPVGGIRINVLHVELLREAGVDAVVWLPTEERPPWFEMKVPVVTGPTLAIGADDVLMVPELPVVPGHDPAPGARKVIMNQNHFYTYCTWPDDVAYLDWSPSPTVWVVSRESLDVMSRLHPELRPRLVPNPIDPELFAPGPRERPSIAWMPRKRPREAALVQRLLASDPRARGVDLHAIDAMPAQEVARTLGSATVFLALGHTESFGLPVAEALAAGCLVVGYPAGGGHELFEAPGAWAVPDQRPLLLVDRAMEVLADPSLAALGAANREWVLDHYPVAATTRALVAAVEDARAQPGAEALATHPFGLASALPADFASSA